MIPAASAAVCETFALPSMGEGGAPSSPLTATQLEALQKAAWDAAYAKGRREGELRGHAEASARVEADAKPLVRALRSMLEALSRPLSALDEQVEQAMLALSFACARQIVRRELRSDPGEVVAAVREALSVLPLGSREVRVHLHRDDIPLVRQAIGGDLPETPWRLVEDPALSRGGCRVESEFSSIDASVDGRLAAVFARVLGGERLHDADEVSGSDRHG